VARPGFAGADPDGARIARVDGDRADRLHRLLVEHRLEARAAVAALPHPAARRADVDQRLPVDVARVHRGDTAAHRRRPDVAGAEAGDDALVENDFGRRLRAGRLERRRLRVGSGDHLAGDGALRILEDVVVGFDVDLLDAEVFDAAAFFAPREELALDVGVLREPAGLVHRHALGLAAALERGEFPRVLAVPGLDGGEALSRHFGADLSRPFLDLGP